MPETLNKNTNLYRGIFWIPDIDDVDGSDLYFQIPCDRNGDINPDFEIPTLMSSRIDYYPRGRTEIKHGIAFVYYSPYIPQDNLKDWLTDKFNLTTSKGIRKIRFVADSSNHYRCYLED